MKLVSQVVERGINVLHFFLKKKKESVTTCTSKLYLYAWTWWFKSFLLMGYCWFTTFQEFDKQLVFPSSGNDYLNVQLLNNFIGLIQLKLYFRKTNSWEFKNSVIISDAVLKTFNKDKHFLYLNLQLSIQSIWVRCSRQTPFLL